jgi:thiol-disulfide isomerase/thioredoxin
MKRLYSFFAVLLLTALSSFAQGTLTRSMDQKSGKEILIGPCYRETLLTVDFAADYNSEYGSYIMDTAVINKLKGKAEDYICTIVLGTWCGDSKEQVPRFLKIVDKLVPGFAGIKFICVDRDKKAGDLDISALKIEKVPTFIFTKDGVEVGRIIETPTETLEKDLMNLIGK